MNAFGLTHSLQDSNKRHIIKTFSWRIYWHIDTSLFGWILTGNPFTRFKIGGFETHFKMILYFGHEKLWYKINFGLDCDNRAKRLKKHKKKEIIKANEFKYCKTNIKYTKTTVIIAHGHKSLFALVYRSYRVLENQL